MGITEYFKKEWERLPREKLARTGLPDGPVIHVVSAGETLCAIALKYYGDPSRWELIFQANQPMLKQPDMTYSGQKLIIPVVP